MDVEYDPDVTTADAVADAVSTLLNIGLSTPDVLDTVGNPAVGEPQVEYVRDAREGR